MSLKIRLTRAGAKKRPFYRIVVADSRYPARWPLHRDRRHVEPDPAEERPEARRARDRAHPALDEARRPADRPRAALPRCRRPGQARARATIRRRRSPARRRRSASRPPKALPPPRRQQRLLPLPRPKLRPRHLRPSKPMSHTRQVVVAQIGAAHGIKGEVRLKSFTQVPLRCGRLRAADARRTGVSSRSRRSRPAAGTSPDMMVVRFKGIRRSQRGRGAHRHRTVGAAGPVAATGSGRVLPRRSHRP